MDVSGYGLTGRQAESALVDSGIVTNRNSIPGDPNGAWYTSGIRLGTRRCGSADRYIGETTVRSMKQDFDLERTVAPTAGCRARAQGWSTGSLRGGARDMVPVCSARVRA